MLILLDKKIPAAAKTKLAAYGEIVDFATNSITYGAVSGHPDIFFCPTPAGLIVAPNLPLTYFNKLDQNAIRYTIGQQPVGLEYPESARYNAHVTDKFIIQNPVITDSCINSLNPDLEIIKVRQGYIRCNLVALPGDCFITSDRGIEKAIKQLNLEVIFVNPSVVKLDGFKHGFFGGACGLHEKTLFLCGSLKYFREQVLIKEFVKRAGIRIIELYDGLPVDVGTIMFLNSAE